MGQFKRNLQRRLLGIPRSIAPVLRVGSRTFVFRDADVREILSRDRDFTLHQVNYENIARHIGPFILGLDDGPEYQHDVQLLRKSVKREDGERIRIFTRSTAQSILSKVNGTFDLIDQYTRQIPYLLVGDYFGVPGPARDSFLRWNRSLFWDVFLDLQHEPEIRAKADQSAQEMMAYLAQLITRRKQEIAAGEAADNMLNRLIRQQDTEADSFDDKAIAGNVSGVYMGALEPLNKACANAIGQIYARPKVLALARRAAQEDDVELMEKIAWEALRFHPNAPLLMRYSEEEQKIGGNGRKSRTIRAGQTLFIMSQSAMFDARAVNRPNEFRTDRPADTYLYFGYGLHKCFGNYVNRVVIPEVLLALFHHPNIEPEGEIMNEGPFPNRWLFRKG